MCQMHIQSCIIYVWTTKGGSSGIVIKSSDCGPKGKIEIGDYKVPLFFGCDGYEARYQCAKTFRRLRGIT